VSTIEKGEGIKAGESMTFTCRRIHAMHYSLLGQPTVESTGFQRWIPQRGENIRVCLTLNKDYQAVPKTGIEPSPKPAAGMSNTVTDGKKLVLINIEIVGIIIAIILLSFGAGFYFARRLGRNRVAITPLAKQPA
jgi:hypothetical protein